MMKVIDAIILELGRQGVAEQLADIGFDPAALARVVIRAADTQPTFATNSANIGSRPGLFGHLDAK